MGEKMLYEMTKQLVAKINKSKGLGLFVRHGKQFEQWLQVEVCEILDDKGMMEIDVEKSWDSGSPDIYYMYGEERCVIELKVITTQGSGEKTNLGKVSADITKLQEYRGAGLIDRGIILFIIYPFDEGENIGTWAKNINAPIRGQAYRRIATLVPQVFEPQSCVFANDQKGYIYCGALE